MTRRSGFRVRGAHDAFAGMTVAVEGASGPVCSAPDPDAGRVGRMGPMGRMGPVRADTGVRPYLSIALRRPSHRCRSARTGWRRSIR
ncbi:MAG TPA: hypothetical protein PLT86_10000, partial [Candidatus Latescibacteria bacterium]|nr:hypothetical protein [Candidatus Latescibacterota bacterium]